MYSYQYLSVNRSASHLLLVLLWTSVPVNYTTPCIYKIRQRCVLKCTDNLLLVEFMYFVFICMPIAMCESYCRRLGSLWLNLCDVFWVLINSLVCWFNKLVYKNVIILLDQSMGLSFCCCYVLGIVWILCKIKNNVYFIFRLDFLLLLLVWSPLVVAILQCTFLYLCHARQCLSAMM